MEFKEVKYSELKNKQQEVYNYAKIAYILSKYGYECQRFLNDIDGADFLAVNLDGTVFKMQQKGRMHLGKKYIGRGIHIVFLKDDKLHIFDHDEVVDNMDELTIKANSWALEGAVHWPNKWSPRITNHYTKFMTIL